MNNRYLKLKQVTLWAKNNEDIRVMLLTSSLANPLAPVDDFSDLDIELVFENIMPYQHDKQWLSNFGKHIAMVEEDEKAFEGKHSMKMVLYEDGVKIDFKLYSKAEFVKEVNRGILPEDWDVGYKVIVDKDHLTQDLKAPTYQSILIQEPTEQKFNQVLNDCWWDMTYVAKCLLRDEIFYAKFMSENMMRTDYLVPLIEWYIASQHQWIITTNKHGRLFKKYLPLAQWKQIEATFSASSIEENWRVLFAYADVVHQVGVELAQTLGYSYPRELESNIRKYLIDVRGK
jgi:aminoglycoside 6-adenylyltransferase